MLRNSRFSLLATALVWSVAIGTSNAQVIFSEDFENGMPAGFTLVDLDGNAVYQDPGVSFVTDAWVTDADFRDVNNTVAWSTSWYDPADTSDDWMITSAIALDANCVLEWEAEAYLASYPDGYEVRIATTTNIQDFLANPPLFSIDEELTVRSRRRVDLAALGYANQTVYIAFRNNSFDDFLLVVDNIQVINRPAVEANLISLTVPGSACQLSASEDIEVVIENFGTGVISGFDISYVINDGNTTDTVTETAAVVQPGDTLTYTFLQKADFSSPGTEYTVSAYITVAGDNISDNNSVPEQTVINVMPHDAATPYTSSFETAEELLGWQIEDHNNDGFSWYLSASVPNNGDLHFRYNWNANSAADDWLYSTCLDIVSGNIYKVTFFHRVGNSQGTIFPEKLQVMIGMSQQASAMDTLKDLGTLTNDYYVEESFTFTAAATGTHFLGFHVSSDADQYFLALDDITFEQLLPPVAGFVTGKNGLQVSFASTSQEADSLFWDFGDGNTSTDNPSAIHTYSTPGTYPVCLTAFNQAGADTFCQDVTVDSISVGVSVGRVAEIKIYPNPTKGFLIVESTSVAQGGVITINDITGKQLLSREFNRPKIIFDLTSLAEGFYFVEVKAGNSSIRERVMLSK